MRKFFKEFRDFSVKGNVVDMAVGVIIGGAFGKIVSSLVNDVIMPPLGLLIGGVDFSELAIHLREVGEGHDAITLRYGLFVNHVVNFIIVAFAIFLVVRTMNTFRRKEAAIPPLPQPSAPPRQEILLEEIRDLLKK